MPDCKWKLLFSVIILLSFASTVAGAERACVLIAEDILSGPANSPHRAARVRVRDSVTSDTITELKLPNGSTGVRTVRISPDARWAAVSHTIGNFHKPTRRPISTWINANALTIIDMSRLEIFGSVLLDDPGRGAANPWGLAFSADSKTLVVTHAGTHEVSIIDFPDLVQRLSDLPAPVDPVTAKRSGLSQQDIDAVNYVRFFPARRQRIQLAKTDRGPRSVSIIGHTAYVTNYFSDTVGVIDFSVTPASVRSVSPGRPREMNLERKGELYFNDATIGFQGWQSCATCHPDGRADGLNWDLLNDGVGNPKNTKSLLLAFQTPPSMSLGVRESPEAAVKAGLKHILFTEPRPEIVEAIAAYIKSLKPTPSPQLVNGRLSPGAQRGREIFNRAGCAVCHPPPLFTDLESYDVGTRASFDRPTDKFDTPTLVELWRTAPYLHDGSAATVRDVLTFHNPHDQHGRTSNLSESEISDLCTYLLSL